MKSESLKREILPPNPLLFLTFPEDGENGEQFVFKYSATLNYLLHLAKLLVKILLNLCFRDSLTHFSSARSQSYTCSSGHLGPITEQLKNT